MRSFWLLMLSWVRKRAFVSCRTGIYAQNILVFKCTNCGKAKSGAITLIWRKTAQKAEIYIEISQMCIYLCFLEDAGIHICWHALKRYDMSSNCTSSRPPATRLSAGLRNREDGTQVWSQRGEGRPRGAWPFGKGAINGAYPLVMSK